ncbi:MAG: hypothetical protein NC078_06335 [Ruminococcus sp.]|nr:hypothetical protein [Ruminococcus sp.]
MARLTWDGIGERFFEMGVSKAVLYPFGSKEKPYDKGVAWNGITNVHESPEGAEATDLWADNIKYASFRSTEDFNGSIEAYTYPDEFNSCNGYKEAAPGMKVSQQSRSVFGLSYRNQVGSDTDPDCTDYKLHLVYGATASPSEREHQTINDSPDAETMSWDFETTPVDTGIEGFKPTAHIEIDSRKAGKERIKALEDILYGTDTTEARLPLPKEVAEILGNVSGSAVTASVTPSSASTTSETGKSK